MIRNHLTPSRYTSFVGRFAHKNIIANVAIMIIAVIAFVIIAIMNIIFRHRNNLSPDSELNANNLNTVTSTSGILAPCINLYILVYHAEKA